MNRSELVLVNVEVGNDLEKKMLCQAPQYKRFERGERVVILIGDREFNGEILMQCNPYEEEVRSFIFEVVGASEDPPKIIAEIVRYEVKYSEV